MTTPKTPSPAVCDYEGSTYRTDFWEGKGRDYEDTVERIALRALLPPAARRYVDFGAGFGRLINEAERYEQVVVVDYSRTMLQDAQARLGRSDRYIYVAADLYRLPFAANSFDAALLCRVIHHLADAPAALKQIQQSLTPGATFVLEFANKLNVKAILRYFLRLQKWSPYEHAPIEFVKLNFDFHPAYIRQALTAAGFTIGHWRSVSWLRLGFFKSILPLGAMVALDRLLQPTGKQFPIAPSIFTENHTPGERGMVVPVEAMFKCPTCGTSPLQRQPEAMLCSKCGAQWPIREGIYDFKEAAGV